MTSTLPEIDRISPTQRPKARAIGYHRWSELLFVHWRVPAAELQPLLPEQLTVDEFDGTAWVGLVPFTMSGVRPWWSPPVPGVSSFHETNVRTYVHYQGRDPGVWFFSLDAASWLAVRIARWRWCLNYYRARMHLQRDGDTVRYASRRPGSQTSAAFSEIEAEIGKPYGNAVPGTLEHFLIERYILYARQRDGRLLQGRVHHEPYPIREAHIRRLNESLVQAAGITTQSPPQHVAYSTGVDVEIFPLRPIEDDLQ